MNRLLSFVLGVVLTVATVTLWPETDPAEPVTRPSTDALMGKCLQAQQVLYRVDRGRAAETCAYDLSTDRHRFERTWANYETVEGSW